MCTSEQQSTTNPSDGDTKAPREPVPETYYDRVRRLPEYKDWIAAGVLDAFAKAYDVEPSFVNRLSNNSAGLIVAYNKKLRTMPTLFAEMRRNTRPDRPLLSNAVAQQWMLDYELDVN
jgi:hypothetical protein